MALFLCYDHQKRFPTLVGIHPEAAEAAEATMQGATCSSGVLTIHAPTHIYNSALYFTNLFFKSFFL